MPLPREAPIYDVTDHLILMELNHDKEQCAIEAVTMKQQLTQEQLHVFEKIISTVNLETGDSFFVYGFGVQERLFFGIC